MELAWITVGKIMEMFLLILVGVVSYRTGVIDSEANKRLSGLLLKVVSPVLILMAYQIDFKAELLTGLLMVMVFSAVSFGLTIGLANLLIRPGSSRNPEIERMAVIYSNCGFIGIPLINGLMGREGVFYMTAYMTVYNMFIWSHGLVSMCGAGSLRETLKRFVQPATIAIGIGLVLFLLRIRLPEVIFNPLDMLGNMNTPLAMLVAGCSLAESDLPGALKRRRTYLISALKLLVVPMLALVVPVLFHADRAVALTVMVGAACPTGAMVSMFALQYDKDSRYATELFTISTVLSLVTIPLAILTGNLLI